MLKSTACVLASGGVDSGVLLAEALKRNRRVFPLYVRCGFRWERAELHSLRRFLRALKNPRLAPLTVLDLPVKDLSGGHWAFTGVKTPGYRSPDSAVYLPGRNILLSKAGVFCAGKKIPRIYIGLLAGNPFPDSSPFFLDAMSRALSAGLRRRVRILSPFRHLSKKDVTARGKALPLHLSFSCLKPRGLAPCGSCNKCAERDKVLTRTRKLIESAP